MVLNLSVDIKLRNSWFQFCVHNNIIHNVGHAFNKLLLDNELRLVADELKVAKVHVLIIWPKGFSRSL